MKFTSLFTLIMSVAGTSAQKVAVEEWLSGTCDGRPFITANVDGGPDGTACVGVEQFPATNMKVRLIEGCGKGKAPVIKVSTGDCSDFAAVATLSANWECIPVNYTPAAYFISCN
ncbi:hypothetical protein FOXB_14325 [Fusarium oxysporum f. sp. conglutinans Fo5176]|uniref:Uncharacterized protein n=1 Tax=Fusarium oxysporum (strain Fo5176) TaxID=660025 RepID=F9G6P3_FUSOF|nr:hypothetical protein FOXB_14325 [Fusarium oxysporum f. sp. conglutinans Fo5176]